MKIKVCSRLLERFRANPLDRVAPCCCPGPRDNVQLYIQAMYPNNGRSILVHCICEDHLAEYSSWQADWQRPPVIYRVERGNEDYVTYADLEEQLNLIIPLLLL